MVKLKNTLFQWTVKCRNKSIFDWSVNLKVWSLTKTLFKKYVLIRWWFNLASLLHSYCCCSGKRNFFICSKNAIISKIINVTTGVEKFHFIDFNISTTFKYLSKNKFCNTSKRSTTHCRVILNILNFGLVMAFTILSFLFWTEPNLIFIS